tara:strand:- start:1343 stop:1843 length:501 start_codon:yes stop_codon:yes gene_type:complete
MATLAPPGGQILDATEFQYGKTDTIVASAFDDPPSWEWSLSPIGETPSRSTEGVNISITPSGWKLIVTYLEEIYLFPIKIIEFTNEYQEFFKNKDWEGVPDKHAFPDLYKMIEDHKSWCEWSLAVTATGTRNDFPASVSGSYVVRVYADYDNSRDILSNQLEMRKR